MTCDINLTHRRWMIISICAVVVNLILVVMGLAITFSWRGDFGNLDNYRFQSKEYCVVCDYDPLLPDIRKTKNKCCGKAKAVLDLLVKKVG